ncbi:response regulator EpsF [Pyxidicoccus sp. MSG2]|uniref:response regulator EpsF n=1 Tax=Pyxidicoccus sp. MSG2 TaxID=2996790 RepID=UPI0022701681|nr:response regulator EpsF [Pyxidicoccus sp. MSG2]MCY1018336.1 response regulator [Pyxidicoccus sp. MSG2]
MSLEGSQQLTASASVRAAPSPTSILMVDDHEANLLALEAILEPLGQRLVRATSGPEALRWLLREDFALLLLDVQMPGMDGFETARLIRQRQRTRYTPIIFLTAHSRDEAHLVHGYATGAADYVVKPFNPDVLRWKVEAFVALYRQQQRLQAQEAALWERERHVLERQSEQRFRRLVDSMPQLVWALLVDGTISYANRGWLEYAGLTPQQARRLEEMRRFMHPEDLPRVQDAWSASLRTGQPLEAEYRLRRAKDGEYRWFLGRTLPERDEEGQLVGWIATATDIDDARRAVEVLRAASEAKDMFLTMAAHELRTPLQAARSYAHLAKVKAGPEVEPAVDKALRGIHRSVNRMASVVENLLDVGWLQRGELSLEPGEVDLGLLLREVVEHFQPLPEEYRIDVEAPESLVLRGDRERLDQVFTNLVANALRYSPGGGPVRLTVREEPGQVHVEVMDRGLGIPAGQLERIFERFSRAHGISYGGLGLGLAISRGIVARHGGRIWAESSGREGEGSTFHVVLPRG